MAKTPYLTVVIPCYNEAENIRHGVLSEIGKYLIQKKYSWEVIISDDGSTDESARLVKERIKGWKGFKILENPHGGKPSALLFGIKKARGRWILFTDMDQSTPITELEKLLPYAGEYKVVIGSRGLRRKNYPFYRQIGAVVFANVRKALILPEVDDTQCGFKLFDKNLLEINFPKLEFLGRNKKVHGWRVTSYDVELLHILKKAGVKIKEVVVLWHNQDVSQSKGGGVRRYFRESKEMLMQIVRVKLNDLKGLYED
jgi:dolichyl-phosphate beta-glucosyltransferase